MIASLSNIQSLKYIYIYYINDRSMYIYIYIRRCVAPNLRKPISRRFCTRMHSCTEICSIVEQHFLRSLSWKCYHWEWVVSRCTLTLCTTFALCTSVLVCFGKTEGVVSGCVLSMHVRRCQSPASKTAGFLIFCSQWLEGSVRPLDFSHGSSVSQAQRVIVGFRIWWGQEFVQ